MAFDKFEMCFKQEMKHTGLAYHVGRDLDDAFACNDLTDCTEM